MKTKTKTKTWRRLIALAGAAAVTASLAGCGGGEKEVEKTDVDVTLDQISLGSDYTDLKADVKFLTNRTDLVDTTFQEYIKEFQEMYPDINVEYEGITSYSDDIVTRLTTGDWGDICMVDGIDKDELSNYFTPLGTKESLGSIYDAGFLDNCAYKGTCYGVPCMVNVQGVVYNKAVFEQAGVTEVPKTPDQFLDALQKIKDNTDAIPLYTNFAAGWTMSAWDGYIDACATGDPDFAYEGLSKGKDPYADRGDGTGPYAVYNVLYEAVSRGLTEDDPTTTDWEGSKGMLNQGKIGCMVLGSWAITQIQTAGDHGDDIGYMAFPISIDGKQYAAAGADYNYGINCNSSKDQQIAAMCYIKYLMEKSDYAQSQGGLSAALGAEYPEALADLEGVELVVNNPAPDEDANLGDDLRNESELGSGNIPVQIVEEATTGTMTFDEMVDEWNEKWTAAQEKYGVTH